MCFIICLIILSAIKHVACTSIPPGSLHASNMTINILLIPIPTGTSAVVFRAISIETSTKRR